jgi:hypothetical protein
MTCPSLPPLLTQEKNRDVHIKRVHTLEKDFFCVYDGCTRGFATMDALSRHIQSHATKAAHSRPEVVEAGAKLQALDQIVGKRRRLANDDDGDDMVKVGPDFVDK